MREGLAGRVASRVAGCNCFPAGTAVSTSTGKKAIEKISVGDQVWARSLTTGRSQLRHVVGLFHKQATGLLTITAGTTVLQVTPQHPFWVPGRGWTDAGTLRTGNQLLNRDGHAVRINKISYRAGQVTVYNFEVEGDHNYYITDAQLLVHNCKATTYSRPSGYRRGVRERVWDTAVEASTGRVRDPVSGRFVSKAKSWDMGHKPGGEFRRKAANAEREGKSRKEFLNDHNNPDNYRPELPASNRGHRGEDQS